MGALGQCSLAASHGTRRMNFIEDVAHEHPAIIPCSTHILSETMEPLCKRHGQRYCLRSNRSLTNGKSCRTAATTER
eukprot:7073180-Pyramimonas_sp.AAC.1